MLDRRGKGVPVLLCQSCNVVATCHTGTKEIDFFLREEGELVDMEKCIREWPEIDQKGTYRELINETKTELNRVMKLVRPYLWPF